MPAAPGPALQVMAAFVRYLRDLGFAEEAIPWSVLRVVQQWIARGPPRDPRACASARYLE